MLSSSLFHGTVTLRNCGFWKLVQSLQTLWVKLELQNERQEVSKQGTKTSGGSRSGALGKRYRFCCMQWQWYQCFTGILVVVPDFHYPQPQLMRDAFFWSCRKLTEKVNLKPAQQHKNLSFHCCAQKLRPVNLIVHCKEGAAVRVWCVNIIAILIADHTQGCPHLEQASQNRSCSSFPSLDRMGSSLICLEKADMYFKEDKEMQK